MKKLSQKVFGRIAVTAALILIQAAWLLVWFTRLAHYAPWVGAVFTALSILIVLYIVRKDDNPAYKIVWIILILLVPLLGGLFVCGVRQQAAGAPHARKNLPAP